MNNVYELPELVSRCLTLGIQMYPFEQRSVMRQYAKCRMPDNLLSTLTKPELNKYVKGLRLSDAEEAREWGEGHRILKSLGFVELKRTEGHRVFVYLVHSTEIIEYEK